jgi:hypothetical protein
MKKTSARSQRGAPLIDGSLALRSGQDSPGIGAKMRKPAIENLSSFTKQGGRQSPRSAPGYDSGATGKAGMPNSAGMTPQLVVMADETLARAFEVAFGDEAFEEWIHRMRDGGFMVEAWTDEDGPPPVFFLLSEGLSEKLMTEEEKDAMEQVEFDEEGVAHGTNFGIKVTPVETGIEDVRISLPAWVSAVPTGAGEP